MGVATAGKIIILLSYIGIATAAVRLINSITLSIIDLPSYIRLSAQLLPGMILASLIGFLGLGLIQLEDYLNNRRRRRNESAAT